MFDVTEMAHIRRLTRHMSRPRGEHKALLRVLTVSESVLFTWEEGGKIEKDRYLVKED
jgi:hypothetical protein